MDRHIVTSGRAKRRAYRVRNRVRGSRRPRPRLSVFRSLNNISAQVIDDATGRTLVAASTMEKTLRAELGATCRTIAGATRIGTLIAERASSAGIVEVAFDRGGNKFHGRVKALAEAARAGGLKF